MNLAITNVGDLKAQADRSYLLGSLAANAGSSAILNVPVPINTLVIVEAVIKAFAGDRKGARAVVADGATDTLTLAAHGMLTGSPVYVVGTGQPGGVTATTIYYARAEDANTLKLYDTQAHAVAGGATGLIDITSAGAGVVVYPARLQAAYSIKAAVRNQNNNVSLLGAASVTAFEDVAGWDATIAADNVGKQAQIKLTPDTVLDTYFEVHASWS